MCWSSSFITTGYYIQKGMLTSEFVRKTQLEADQIAARQIQQTLILQRLPELPGYEIETFYKPFREIGGDYFDVIELPSNRTLFTVADVSGKGMPAALLAANIQALVRSIVSVEPNPLALARQINKHLSRYTPSKSLCDSSVHRAMPRLGRIDVCQCRPQRSDSVRLRTSD